MIEDYCVFGNRKIVYRVDFTERKTLKIVVLPNKSIEVKAPESTSLEVVKTKVLKRATWIIKQWLHFDSFGIRYPERRYVSGESHLYLGRQYLLRVMDSKVNSVRYKGRYFEVECNSKEKAKILMQDWYKNRAQIKLTEISIPIVERFSSLYGVKPKSFKIQEMSARWGSCTKAGKITLNTELIKAPKPCIEYVITHELCHLVHHNHTKAFFDLLLKEMPDWQKWKNKLELMM